jgi:XTP/dITP diphosphohydrolase
MTRKFEGTELVIATHNAGKLAEFRRLFGDVPLPRPRGGRGQGQMPSAQLHLRPANMPTAADTSHLTRARTWGERIRFLSSASFALPAPDETGKTFLENATIKALFVAQATERPALADDSGLCVNALNGAPGVYSADWAETPHGRDYNAAMQKIYAEMGGSPDRSAYFVCCMALAWPDGHVESVEAHVDGMIVRPPRGQGGFGYDPLFLPRGSAQTYAELDDTVKSQISHRAAAFEMMMDKCFRY